MDRSTPWRVLDEAPSTESAGPGAGDDRPEESRERPLLTPRLVAGLLAAGLLAVAAFGLAASGPTGSVVVDGGAAWASDGAPSRSNEPGSAELLVDVQGAVLRPGLLRLPPGSRVGDAIAAAGGYGPRVDAARAATELNLAAPVRDGDRVVVPARGDPRGPAGSAGGSGGGDGAGGLVDLNTATAEQLDALPGIGPVTAKKIIDARAEKAFATVDELRERKIVGAATFEKLRELVTVR
jgi:competence protein ComEA